MTMQNDEIKTVQLGKSLSRRFGLTMVGVVTAIFMIFSLVVGWYNYAGKEAELQRQLGAALRLAETSLPEAVWKVDHRSINDILRAILTNNAVIFCRVMVDEEVVATQVAGGVGADSLEEFDDTSAFLVSSAAIRREGIEVGNLQIVMSKDAIYRELSATTATIVGLLLLLIIAILCTSMLILRHYIFRPLALLEKSARRIAAGNLETPIDIVAEGEIGSLAATLRIMTNHLKESFEQLEQKVRERTADLFLAKLAAEETSRHLSVVGAELQALLDNSPVGIVFVDNKGVIKKVNQEMEKISGYSEEELVGDTVRQLYATAEAYKNITAKVMPLLKSKGSCERQSALQRKDGVEIICRLHGRVVLDEGGLEGIVWSVEDITNRIRMENELLRTKKQESINVLAGGIAHDFNNILFAVLGNISLAERMVSDKSPIGEYLRTARMAALRAKELTIKLLNFADDTEPVKATASLPQLIRDAVGLVLAGSHRIRCSFEFPEDLWVVSMDKEQISQVIVSLVQNAEQSMADGGCITIRLANRELVEDQVAGLYPGKYVQISLADEGQGIEADHLDRIFDPYFSTKERNSNKGAGLALAIVHSIINKHEGKIVVESTPGGGTIFILFLPALLAETAAEGPQTAILPSGKGRVLVVDADAEVQAIVGDMLHHIGYTGQAVSDGLAAVEMYQAALESGQPFDAVLLDMAISGDMAAMTAAAVLRQIHPQIKLVAGISSQQREGRNGSIDGFWAVIAKPYQLLELNRVMAAINGVASPAAALE